jgi:predicted RNA binding protein YcfA (HicA-like mRNA interferase family)
LPDKIPALKTDRVVRALEAAGFERVRQSGSHLILARPDAPTQVIIAMHKRELGPRIVRKIIAQAGLTPGEFLKHV